MYYVTAYNGQNKQQEDPEFLCNNCVKVSADDGAHDGICSFMHL